MSKCKSCGEKPQKSRAFPSAVVEINNPEQLVLLRKVVIPASMPEETNPPVIGRYKNVILQYEDTNHLYIYSSDGIPTPIEANIPQEILDRIDTLEADVDNLERDLADETEARQTGDSDLSDRIDGVVDDLADEVDARELADERLEDAIDTKQDQLTAGANIAIVDESGVLTISAVDTIYDDTEIRQELADEALARQQADNTLQSEIDTIVASSDVKDIVGTYAELEGYDTSTLGDRDIIKVLQDETQLDQTTYYRWSTSTETFSLIGTEGPYYTKAQTNELLDEKQDELTPGENISIVDESGSLVISATDTTYTVGYGLELNGTEFSVDPDIVQDTLTAGDNITIEDESGSLVISATDTTYSAFTGTDGTAAGTAGLVPAPATTDAGKFLKADGTWDTAGGGASYTAGEGIDITNAVISATNTGKARELTAADYNYHSSGLADDGLAPWLLSPGLYYYNSNMTIYGDQTNKTTRPAGSLLIVRSEDNGRVASLRFAGAGIAITDFNSNGSVATAESSVLRNTQVVDNLTSTSAYRPLSANQGRVLKGLIDAIPAPTTYTAGTGLDLTGTEFSVDFNDVQGKLTAGQGISIVDESGDLVISATSTGPTVVQTTGTSTTDVMSQNAVTSMVFADPGTKQKVQLGAGAVASANYSVSIGRNASTYGADSVAVGHSSQANYASCVTVGSSAKSTDNYTVAIGAQAKANMPYSVAVGTFATAGAKGEMNIGTGTQTTAGYNNSNYRLISGVYDGQSAHDAATKGQLDAAVTTIDAALDAKQDELTPGTGISITEESGALVISATGASIATINAQDWSALWQ